MNKNLIIGVIIILILGVFGLYFYNNTEPEKVAGCDPNCKTQIEIIKQFSSNWTEFRKNISQRPTLGSTEWSSPTDYQFIGKNRMLVMFEDGHMVLVSVVQYECGESTCKFNLNHTFENDIPFSQDEWNKVIDQYGDPKETIRSYTRQIVRGVEIVSFDDWTEVSENIFVSNYDSGKTAKIKIPLTAPYKAGVGSKFGCDEMIVYMEKEIPQTTQPLNQAYKELFALKDVWVKYEPLKSYWYSPSDGLYNVKANLKNLTFDRATIENGVAKVYLKGNFGGLGGVCDDPRVQPQLEAVAKQFITVQSVQIYLNGQLFNWTGFGSQQ